MSRDVIERTGSVAVGRAEGDQLLQEDWSRCSWSRGKHEWLCLSQLPGGHTMLVVNQHFPLVLGLVTTYGRCSIYPDHLALPSATRTHRLSSHVAVLQASLENVFTATISLPVAL